MAPTQWLIALIPIAYVAGSIPFGLIVGLAKGVDPRMAGSGNIGATNVGRLLGGRYFALVFVLDLLKGLLPVVAGGMLLRTSAGGIIPQATGAALHSPHQYSLWLAVAFAAIAGHMFSVFLKFQGGKGVATSLGVILGVYPFYTLAGVAAGLTWGVVFWRTRIVSIASIIAAGVFPVAYAAIGLYMKWPIFGGQWPLLAFAAFVAGMIVYKHRSNIARLRAGTESRISQPTASTRRPNPD